MLTYRDIEELTEIRRALHAAPELSGEEAQTAKVIATHLAALSPTQLVTGIGGHGVIAEFASNAPGPTVMIRCELDALPIEQMSDRPYRSTFSGKAHLCGHDGHMAIVLGLARSLNRAPPVRGRVVLLFQPAEETGAGARAVLDDPKFQPFLPDFAFALHNLPGEAHGMVACRSGPLNCASTGIKLRFEGIEAHASSPELGRSPGQAISKLIDYFSAQHTGGSLDESYALTTLVHAEMGARAFGVAPGTGEVWATLRTLTDKRMAELVADVLDFAKGVADAKDLELTHEFCDRFTACVNDPATTAIIERAARSSRCRYLTLKEAMRFSEDFGLFGSGARSSMLFLGAGEDHPPLHHPAYDFPDTLIEPGAKLFRSITDTCLEDRPT